MPSLEFKNKNLNEHAFSLKTEYSSLHFGKPSIILISFCLADLFHVAAANKINNSSTVWFTVPLSVNNSAVSVGVHWRILSVVVHLAHLNQTEPLLA